MEAVLTVISKVAVMLILIVVGYLVTKKGMLTERGASEITTLLVFLCSDCRCLLFSARIIATGLIQVPSR